MIILIILLSWHLQLSRTIGDGFSILVSLCKGVPLFRFLLHNIIDKSINISMDNITIDYIHTIPHQVSSITKVHYQSAANKLILLHNASLSSYNYRNKDSRFEWADTSGPVEELQNTEILLLEWLVDEQCVLCVGKDGSIFTVKSDGEVDIKAQNQDGIAAASVSPTQEYIYVVTNNKSLIQLNKQFDLVNEIPIDSSEDVLVDTPVFSWRADGTYFILNYNTSNGRKAVTKDIMMATFISPAKSDPKEDGLVQSVSEKGKKNMLGLVSWQPSGSIVAGVDYQLKGEEKQFRVIFWEKNGLRHLEFSLINNISEVIDLFWSLDSSVLFVRVKTANNSHKLLLYYRANYHWFLKSVINLQPNDHCLSLSCQKHKNHKLLIVGQSDFQILDYAIRHSEKQWKTLEDELKVKHQFQYFIDGNVLNITDFSKCLMPPPMSMFKPQFQSNIVGFSKGKNFLLVITEKMIHLYDIVASTKVISLERGILKDQRIFGVHLLSTEPLQFIANSFRFSVAEGKLLKQQKQQPKSLTYNLSFNDQSLHFQVSFENEQLKVNGNILSEQCTSYVFYHQFLIFTVSTSNMYDKLFVVNLVLDEWIQHEDSRFKEKLSEFQSKDLLNHRLIERGSRIVAITQGRVVFQLPRGNLEGIYPKIIMINQVQKKINQKDYKTAFEIIRTHKLDFNLLYDLNPEQFLNDIQHVLKGIKRTDYINLLVSQITDSISSELQYALSSKKLQDFQKDFEINMKGKKVKTICRAVSNALRAFGKEDYILSIFTSEIREGRLNEVLFQIKELKQNDVETVLPPHLINVQAKKDKKKLSSQQILEYVCWLVDANAIYEAALLTYDLQLAAMTARCTQKDPKEYIPYLESLKEIKDPIEFRKKICLDLKRYEIAVKELSKGTEQQKKESLELIKTHKLFKHGLIIYAGKEQLRRVKELIIEQLSSTGEVNEAYRVCQSIGEHKRAIQFAIKSMDTQKIRQCIEIIYPTHEEKIKVVIDIINQIKDEIKSRVELSRLYVYIGKYQEAVSIYLKHNDYKRAYQYLWKVSEQFREKDMKEGFNLCFSVKRNEILRDKKEFLEKYTRLLKVHKHKAEFGEAASFKPRQNDDMYSQVSVNSKSQSNYTISTTTGMRKKKDKKRSILTRNVKEGSLLEEEYLLAYIKSLEDKVQDNVKDAKLLIQHLICMNLIEQAEILRNQAKQYISVFNTYKIKSYARTKFQELHPQASELYFQQRRFANLSIDSFNYLF